MADTLYGYDPSAVVTDAAGNVFAGRVANVHTTYVGNNPFTATKTVNPATLTAGAPSGGVVTADASGRAGFFAVDYVAVLYLDYGDGKRWPVNPTKISEIVTKATTGLGNVDNTSDANKPVSIATAAALATYRPKGATIRPDQFTGTDAQKLQAAVNYCIANSYPTIILDRMLDLTGAAPISVDKAFWYRRETLTFEGTGGGIIKNSAGVVFTSATANTGDLSFHKVKYVSTTGAGAILMDADKLIRFFSSGCEYRNWDMIVRQVDPTRWAQSMRYTNEKMVGGAGPAFYWRECYDVVLDGNLCEDRNTGTTGGFLHNSDGTMGSIANRALKIISNVIENGSGIPLKLAMCWGTLIEGNYFESNGQLLDSQIDLYTLATASAQCAVTLNANMITQKPAQRNIVPAVLLGLGRPKDLVISSGNVSEGGCMYQFGGATGLIQSEGDYVENAGPIIWPGQEHRFFTPGGKSTTTFARPKNPRIGQDIYFDTDLNKLIVAKTAGTKGIVSFRISGGATASGDLTLTMVNKVFPPVPVLAGDTITQVRDKLVAAVATWFPTYKPTAVSTNVAQFNALVPGRLVGIQSLAAGGTGVTSDYFAIDVIGTDPVWVEPVTASDTDGGTF